MFLCLGSERDFEGPFIERGIVEDTGIIVSNLF